ncbi:MAG: 30S ribosomal protein S6 [bacterium]|nr:MAG: 30S ribosomal protein S6 [bacterium]
MKKYEVIYIADPEKTDENVALLAEEIKGFIEKEGGSVDHVEQWGKKKLAYPVKKNRYGFYTLLLVSGQPEIVLKIERSLKLNESIIKYVTLIHHPLSAIKPTQMETTSSHYQQDSHRRDYR